VQAPTLALYGTTFFPLDRSDLALTQKLRDFDHNTTVAFQRTGMERLRRKWRNVKVQQIDDRTHTAMGVQQPHAVAAAIQDFLPATAGA
jgi:hypothetical protein